MAASTSSFVGILADASFCGGAACALGVKLWAKTRLIRNTNKTMARRFFISAFRFPIFVLWGSASQPESLGRNLQSRRGLLALVFAPLNHAHHVAHQLDIITALCGDLLRRAVILHVVIENVVQNLIRRQRVTVFLTWTQLSGRRFLQCGFRNYRIP